jgi:hypothetical protein
MAKGVATQTAMTEGLTTEVVLVPVNSSISRIEVEIARMVVKGGRTTDSRKCGMWLPWS